MVSSELLKEFGFEEEIYEESQLRYLPTGYPKPLKRYRLVYEVYDLSLEETYFWILKYLRYDTGFVYIDKIEDAFAASEGSAFYGVIQQRVGFHQDKVSQFLATIGKMVKELFQLVRELRILDERISYYQGAQNQLEKPRNKRRKSDEITLKGIFIDLVQGGAKNAASVYGMARELEFTVLPDLFFDAPPFKSPDEMEEYIDNLEFNRKVIEVLKRHLRHFWEWKKRTYKEMIARRKFTIQYFRQHFDIIKMYMEWVKPYLRNIERLEANKKHSFSPDLITAFEGSMIDIEFLAQRPHDGPYFTCVLATFNYRTRPSMKFVQEGYNRGPVHVGKLEMNLRGYAWKKDSIEKYKKMKERESIDLLKTISASVSAAMEALGEDLFGYLEEAADEKNKKKEAPKQKDTLSEKLFRDFISSKKSKPKKKENKRDTVAKSAYSKNEAKKEIKTLMFITYKNFKKAHKLVMW